MKGRKPNLVPIAGGKVGRSPSPPGSLNDHAKTEWKRVAPLMHERGHLTDDTLATLEAYCRAVGLSRSYSEQMDKDGHVIETDRGPRTHPAFKMLMGVMRESRLLAAELGLTPHRRVGQDKESKANDGWDEGLLA